jgi:hypothetical protein
MRGVISQKEIGRKVNIYLMSIIWMDKQKAEILESIKKKKSGVGFKRYTKKCFVIENKHWYTINKINRSFKRITSNF